LARLIIGEAQIIVQRRVVAHPGQSFLVQFLGPGKVSLFLITLGQLVQEFEIVGVLLMGLFQLLEGHLRPSH
jgi:hypothetical protein